QHAELLPWLTALDNVMFGLEMKGMRGAELRETGQRYLDLVGLKDSGNRRPYQLSGGMQQRVGIARALAIDPKVLLMDEPFGALDAQTRETMQAELIDIHARTRKTILFVTHDLDEAVLLADRVVVMQHGSVQEIMDIPLPRPRGDLEALRGSAAFAETRYTLWLAIIVGVPLGLVIGRFRVVEAALGIYVTAGYAMPLVALVPLLILWLGLGFAVKAAVVFLMSLFPICINTWLGVTAVPKSLIEV